MAPDGIRRRRLGRARLVAEVADSGKERRGAEPSAAEPSAWSAAPRRGRACLPSSLPRVALTRGCDTYRPDSGHSGAPWAASISRGRLTDSLASWHSAPGGPLVLPGAALSGNLAANPLSASGGGVERAPGRESEPPAAHSLLVAKVADSGNDHSCTGLLGRLYDLGVAHRATRLGEGGDPRFEAEIGRAHA